MTRPASALAALLFVAPFLGAAPVRAQTGPAALRAGHDAYYNDYDLERASRLISIGLDPTAGPTDSTWVRGVYELADVLEQLGDERLGGFWMRWAFRHMPDMPLDTLMSSALLSRARVARAYVDSTRPVDVTLRVSWRWPAAAPARAQQGTVRVQRQDYAVTVQLDDGTLFAAGADRALPPGTHRLRFSAPNYRPTSVRVEVLPGVTTVVDLDMIPLFGGVLYVASEPWAVVYVDGDSVGYTMLGAHSLPAGRHTIRIVRDGYLPFDTTVVVAQQDSLRLGTIQLRRAGGGGRP